MTNKDTDFNSDLYTELAQIIEPKIKAFALASQSYPHAFDTHEEWVNTLGQIWWAFHLINTQEEFDADPFFEQHPSQYLFQLMDRNKAIKGGLDLFAKHFTQLWS